MSLTKEASLAQTETNVSTTDKLNRLQVFADLSSLFAEKLWVEQNNKEIRQLITNIVTATALHLDDQYVFRCGNFLIQMDPNNKEHLFIDQNRNEAVRVTAVPQKKGLGIQILRVPCQTKKASAPFAFFH